MYQMLLCLLDAFCDIGLNSRVFTCCTCFVLTGSRILLSKLVHSNIAPDG